MKFNLSSARNRFLDARGPGFFLLALIISCHFSVSYMQSTVPMIPLVPYLHIYISTPYAYRVLTALLYRPFVFTTHLLHIHFPHLNPPVDSLENWYMVLLIIASLLTAVYCTAAAAERVTGDRRWRWIALAQFLCCYFNFTLVLNRNLLYPYDLPAFALFSVLTCLAIFGNFWLFAIVWIPAILAKETAVFAILILFLLHVSRTNWSGLVLYASGLLAIFAAIKYLLYRWLYHPCPGCPVIGLDKLRYNAGQLFNPLFWMSFLSMFGYLWVALVLLWPWVSRRFRYTFAITFACWFVVMFRFGILREVRLFAELSTLLLIVIAQGAHKWLMSRESRDTAVSGSG